MKYNENNKPLVCMLTNSTCYKGTRKFTPKGILWHSTGSNNPFLKRYVQPADNDPRKDELLKLLGKNQYGNDWNHAYRECGMNFFIGKLADGTVTAVQTMPWDYRPWGCASGSNGTGNDIYIQFEIGEDGLTDRAYFDKVYQEACEMTAYLCKMFDIDPHGTIDYKGQTVPTIIDHWTSYKLNIGSGHSDLTGSNAWFPKMGKTLDNVRNDVAKLMGAETKAVVLGDRTLKNGMRGDDVQELQEALNKLGFDCGTADGIFGTKTQNAVIAFQKAKGLDADGIFGQKSLKALKESAPAPQPVPAPAPSAPEVSVNLPVLKFGAQDKSTAGTVANLQTLLNKKGAKLDVDGEFGSKTQTAVRDFQIKRGLSATGEVNNLTWTCLIEN